ncbi:MAG: DUF5077 domain-containing protein, partial [Segetibacter sp.]
MKTIALLFGLLFTTDLIPHLGGEGLLISGPTEKKRIVFYADSTILLPLGGNTWAQNIPARTKIITNNGIENWTNAQVSFNTYFRVDKPGSIKIKLKAKTDGQSDLQLEIIGVKKALTIKGSDFQLYDAGEWILRDTGYIKIVLTGISKTGDRYADVSEYDISGSAINSKTAFVKNNEGNFFYWGRRGPSV